jgi:hypothetical protein
MDRPTEADWIYLKRILKYLRGTSNYGLLYRAGNIKEMLKGTRIVQADSGSDSDSESRRRSPRSLPAGWDRRVEADYRSWL